MSGHAVEDPFGREAAEAVSATDEEYFHGLDAGLPRAIHSFTIARAPGDAGMRVRARARGGASMGRLQPRRSAPRASTDARGRHREDARRVPLQGRIERGVVRVVAKLFARGWLEGGREEAAIDLEAGVTRRDQGVARSDIEA
jgi:hypothetical protein